MKTGTKVREVIVVTEDDDGTINEYRPNMALVLFGKVTGMGDGMVEWSTGYFKFSDPRLSERVAARGAQAIQEILDEIYGVDTDDGEGID